MNAALSKLIGKRFNSIFRVTDMLCLNIGENIDFRLAYDRRLNDKKILQSRIVKRPELSFHVQTQWRFVKDEKILLASHDIYEPFSPDVPSDWDWDIFDRQKEESSVFDAERNNVNSRLESCKVKECGCSPIGDLKMIFSDGTLFETFTPASKKDEEWRLIDFRSDAHYVVFDVQ